MVVTEGSCLLSSGEVGLDRIFRIPFLPFGAHNDVNDDDPKDSAPKLSPFHVPLEHQLVILEAQIDLALEYGRNISMHSVKAQQASVDLLDRLVKKDSKRFHAISLDFHSCSLSAETWANIQVSTCSIH